MGRRCYRRAPRHATPPNAAPPAQTGQRSSGQPSSPPCAKLSKPAHTERTGTGQQPPASRGTHQRRPQPPARRAQGSPLCAEAARPPNKEKRTGRGKTPTAERGGREPRGTTRDERGKQESVDGGRAEAETNIPTHKHPCTPTPIPRRDGGHNGRTWRPAPGNYSKDTYKSKCRRLLDEFPNFCSAASPAGSHPASICRVSLRDSRYAAQKHFPGMCGTCRERCRFLARKRSREHLGPPYLTP